MIKNFNLIVLHFKDHQKTHTHFWFSVNRPSF